MASSASVQMIRMIIKGLSWNDTIKRMEDLENPVFLEALKKARCCEIYTDGYSIHVLAAAIYFVDTSNSFDNMLEKAIEFSGGNNYCAVLAGSLGGARWGASHISEFWLKGNKDQGRI